MTDTKAALDAFRRIHGWSLGKVMYDNVTEDFYLVEKALTTPPAPEMEAVDRETLVNLWARESNGKGISFGEWIIHNYQIYQPTKTAEAIRSHRDFKDSYPIRAATAPKTTDAQGKALEAFEQILDGNFRYQRHYESAVAEVKATLQSPAVPMEVVEKAIGEAIGEATMCWNPRPSGVFQSERAIEIANRLIALLGGKEG